MLSFFWTIQCIEIEVGYVDEKLLAGGSRHLKSLSNLFVTLLLGSMSFSFLNECSL